MIEAATVFAAVDFGMDLDQDYSAIVVGETLAIAFEIFVVAAAAAAVVMVMYAAAATGAAQLSMVEPRFHAPSQLRAAVTHGSSDRPEAYFDSRCSGYC